jgi:hypothetical protein
MTEQLPRIYDPCGMVEVETSPLAPRPDTDNGLRLAVLSNTKWNAAKLLRATVRALNERGQAFAAVQHYDKDHFSSPASDELINRIAADNDIAITAIGDCGSCCSACVNDGVRLEQAGLPTAVIVTTEFEHEAKLQREARGMADLQLVVISHPVSSLTLEQLDGRAAQAAPQARAIWFDTTPKNLIPQPAASA